MSDKDIDFYVPTKDILKAYNELGFIDDYANEELYEILRKAIDVMKFDDKQIIGTLQMLLINVIKTSMNEFALKQKKQEDEALR